VTTAPSSGDTPIVPAFFALTPAPAAIGHERTQRELLLDIQQFPPEKKTPP
jgi:hypothetical protein